MSEIMSENDRLKERIKDLEQEVERLTRVNESLMDRVERKLDEAGSSYSLFEYNLLLQNKVKEHTQQLVDINENLKRENIERKKTEKALRWERNFVNAVFDRAGALIIVLDVDGKIVRFNRKCEEISGYSFNEIKNRNFTILLPVDDVLHVQKTFDQLVKMGQASAYENEWISKTGEKRLISWSNTILKNEMGQVRFVVGIGIDITTQREAENKLKLYHRVFMSSSDGISILDADLKFIEVNPANEHYLSLMKDQIIKPDGSINLSDERLQVMKKDIDRMGRYRGEFIYTMKDGSQVYVDLSVFPIYDSQENVQYYVGMGRNVTQIREDKRKIAARLKYENGLAGCSQILLENGDADVVIPRALMQLLNGTDASGLYIFENMDHPEKGLCMNQLYGVEENRSRPIIRHPDLQELPYNQFVDDTELVLRDNKPIAGPLHALPKKIRPFLEKYDTKSILMLPIWVNQAWYGFMGFLDMKEEHEWTDEEIRMLRTAVEMISNYFSKTEALDALQSSEERFRMLVENSNNIILSLDKNNRIKYLSPKYENYTGKSPEKFIGKNISDLIFSDDVSMFNEWLNESVIAGDKDLIGLPFRIIGKNKGIRWFIMNASVILDEENKVSEVIGVAHDITELRHVVDELEKTNNELRATQSQLVQSEKMASLGMLVAGIAHEINTPIGSVNSMHNTLIRVIKRLRSSLEEQCQANRPDYSQVEPLLKIADDANAVIKTGVERVTTIVRRLRSFARLDEAELKTSDIHEGLEDTLTLIHHEIKHNIEVIKNYGDIKPIPCYMGRLNQVFVNMLINAKQAIKGKGWIRIATYKKENQIYIEMEDSGSGIPPTRLNKIFDPGFTTKGVGIGTGLGLSICYQIIQDHHGEILVDSEVGRGSKFTIILPTNLDEILGIS